jgi:phage terminase large subunit GpA-like protein
VTPTLLIPGIADTFEVVRNAMRAGARPDPKMTVSEWADTHRMLTTRSSPEPGKWSTARTPFLRDIMDSLSPSSPWERIVFMKGSQIGATECGNNWIGYVIHLAPGPMMCVQPTTDMVKRNSKQRIAPLIHDSPVLRGLVKESRTRDSGNTLLAKEFLGGILVMTGANSAKGLRSMAARYLFLDEVDGYKESIDNEGDPCDLAIARTTNFGRRKIFIASTPTLTGRSKIARFFDASDQCYYHVPCPRCGSKIVLLSENLIWSEHKMNEAAYRCQECEREIFDHEKQTMLAEGEWRSTAEGDGTTRGYHLSSLYSPVGWLSWTQIVEKREKAEGSTDKQQVFWNTILGLPFQNSGEVPDVDRLYERRESYTIGEVPEGGLILTAGGDVQPNRIEAEIVAWGRDMQSWSVDYRVLEGNTNQPDVWSKLAAIMDEDFPVVGGGSMRIAKLAVDSGYNTMRVYDFVRAMLPQRVMAIKGESHVASLIGSPSLIEIGPGGRQIKGGVRLWPVNTAIAKEELYRWLKLSEPDLRAGENWPRGFCHFPSYAKEFFEQLCAEQLISRSVMGQIRTHWEKRRDRNEALDCRIYARAAAVSMRLDAWPEYRWDEAERLIGRPRNIPSAERPEWTKRPAPKFRPMQAGEGFLD